MSQGLVLLIGLLFVASQCLMLFSMHSLGAQIEELWQALAKNGDCLEPVVLIGVVLEKERVAVTHIRQHR